MTIKTVTILLLCAIPNVSHAAKWLLSEDIRTAWGDVSINYCNSFSSHSSICIGQSETSNCKPFTHVGARYNEEYALALMLARNVTKHGALFCPTQVDAPNNTRDAWTEYREVNGNQTCVWLCKDGYSGDQCQTPPESADGTCDINPFLRINYANVTIHHGGGNIEDSIPLFALNHYQKCSGLNAEYDIGLVINGWLPSGNGAFAQKTIIRALRLGYSKSSAALYYASGSKDILVCKMGYKPNLANTDCEPIDPDKCNATKASSMMCDGWNISKYSESEHKLELTTTNDCRRKGLLKQLSCKQCYKYSCTKSGYAFTSPTDHTCIECATNSRNGVHPVDGTCVKCPTGKIFDAENPDDNYCTNAIGFTKTDLMYGRGKTKDNVPLKDQCWTKTSTDEYKECVLSGDNATSE